jgi:hypothetical protein
MVQFGERGSDKRCGELIFPLKSVNFEAYNTREESLERQYKEI